MTKPSLALVTSKPPPRESRQTVAAEGTVRRRCAMVDRNARPDIRFMIRRPSHVDPRRRIAG